MTKKLHYGLNRAIKWVLILGVIGFLFLPLEIFGELLDFGSIIDEGFETYENGFIINTLDNWFDVSNLIKVSDTTAYEGIKSLKNHTNTGWAGGLSFTAYHIDGDTFKSGNQSVWFKSLDGYATECGSIPLMMWTNTFAFAWFQSLVYDADNCKVQLKYINPASETITDETFINVPLSLDEWHYFKIEWDWQNQIRFTLNATSTDWITIKNLEDKGGYYIKMEAPFKASTYWDTFKEEERQYGDLRVWGVSPESGSTITNLTDIFTFYWEEFDPEVYGGLLVSFYEKNTKIHTAGLLYDDITEISGQKEVNLEDFGFDKNGDYYFHAISWEKRLELIGGMFLSPTGWIEVWTGDLVSPDYYLDIAIEGFSGFFEMEVFLDWYAINSKFATPTDLFSAIAEFLNPIYSKIGEFGNRVISFIDTNTAYSKGANLGIVIPATLHYVSAIEFLIGGFPIVKIFLGFLLIIIGIFAFKLIMKFIPFFG